MDRASHAFVIWIDGPAAGRELVGRIEHVQSAERGSFASAEEMLAFVAAHCDGGAARGGDDGR